jgi:hypothetical protein
MPSTYEPIATTTLGTSSSTINFTSIPATYTDLRLVLVNINSSATDILLRVNSDTGSNYSRITIRGDGTSTSTVLIANQPGINFPNPTSATLYSICDYNFFSYAGSTNKTVLTTASADRNGTGNTVTMVGLWRNTAAITAINLLVTSGSFSVGTTATLYGIKNA